MKLKVNEIFKSYQGEGFNTGKEVIFLRLAGCNLKCEWCDTNHNTQMSLTVEQIVVRLKDYNCKNVIITGGEPTIQPLRILLYQLKVLDYWVGIETNGTNGLDSLNCYLDYVSVSPKLNNAAEIRLERADEVRVVTNNINVEQIKEIENKIFAWDYYLSPVEKDNTFNIETTLKLLNEINKAGGVHWQISLQTHKLAGIE